MQRSTPDPSDEPVGKGPSEDSLPPNSQAAPDAPGSSGPDPSHGPPVVESSAPVGALPPTGSRLIRLPRAYLLRDAILLIMLLFVLFGSMGLALLGSSEARELQVRLALGVITRTPTPTFTPTLTRTPTPTLTPTTTPTLTPSPTPSPTLTLAPSPTPMPSWVSERYLPLPLNEKWIEVNLAEQLLTAYDGTTVVLTTTISSGRANTPTVQGKFRVQRKFESAPMAGPGYYLPGVPHIMYFYGNFALHGAYWHDKWGTRTSHGCVNINLKDAKWLYEWADPKVPSGAREVKATAKNPGTWVLIHK